MTPDKQFKKFIIITILIASTLGYLMLKPDDLFAIKQNVIKISGHNSWQQELKEEGEIDDIDLEVDMPTEKVRYEEKENFFEFRNNLRDDDKYWVAGSVPINPMSDLNYKTKSDIYKIRQKFVEKTMFKNRNYTPDEDVFGQIVDKRPWMSIESLSCFGKSTKSNIGLSEESRFINNPTILVGLDRLNFDKKPRSECSVVDYLMPNKISYSKDENTITVIFEISTYKGFLKNFLLKGLNARDLGFQYSFADIVSNVNFVDTEKNITRNIHIFKDFIHLGSACGVRGGCNNGSPYQSELNFTVIKYPATIHLKLWKKLPNNENSDADLNYLMILK